MAQFIALLRAINVGGHTVKMDRLREIFEAMGFSSVETFIASGNVIFQSSARNAATLEKKIESQLRESLGYEVSTFLRSPAEMQEVAQYQPYPSSELEKQDHQVYIAFLPAPPNAEAAKKLLAFRTAELDFRVRGREIYWLFRVGFADSAFSGSLLERAIGMPMTMRNVTTIGKLAAKYPAVVARPGKR